MDARITVSGTSIKALDRVLVDEGLALLGVAEESGAIPLVLTNPQCPFKGKLPQVRRGWFQRPGVAFIRTTSTGLRQVSQGESPPIDETLPFVVSTKAFNFVLVLGGFSARAGTHSADEEILLDVVIRGQAAVGSMEALIARTQEGLHNVLVSDWAALCGLLPDGFAGVLGERTYAEHKVAGLPGRPGVARESALCQRLEKEVAGALAELRHTSNVYSFQDVAVCEVRPPEHVRKAEAAQEALVSELSEATRRESGEPLWGLRARISAAVEAKRLDPENGKRLTAAWEARAEAVLMEAARATTDVAATRSIVEAAELADKTRLVAALAAREAELANERYHAECGALKKDATELYLLADVPGVRARITEAKLITDDDRAKLLGLLEDQRIGLEVAEVSHLISAWKLDEAEARLADAGLPTEKRDALISKIRDVRAAIRDQEEMHHVSEFIRKAEACETLETLDALQSEVAVVIIANPERAKRLTAAFAAVREELSRIIARTEKQRPASEEFASRIPGASREELTLIQFQVERFHFTPALATTLAALVAGRDQVLRDEVEARVSAEVERRLAEVDVQARVVIAANQNEPIRARLDQAAGLLKNEVTRTQAGIALLAANTSDRGVRDGFLADAAALLGGEARPALTAGSPGELAAASGNGREPQPAPRVRRSEPRGATRSR